MSVCIRLKKQNQWRHWLVIMFHMAVLVIEVYFLIYLFIFCGQQNQIFKTLFGKQLKSNVMSFFIFSLIDKYFNFFHKIFKSLKIFFFFFRFHIIICKFVYLFYLVEFFVLFFYYFQWNESCFRNIRFFASALLGKQIESE